MSNFRLKTKYGITQEERDGMLAEQSGACASCGDTEVKFVVDHNHNTGAIRGILCSPCNLALGHLHDDPERIEALLTYLTKQPVDA